MNKTQKILYNLLCDFDDICRENDIPYYVIGGTLLGGVRHEGFLPWDDDIDVLVKRKDYERLNKVMQSYNMKDRVWVSQENTPEFLNPIAKFFDTSTTLCFMTLFYDGSPNSQHLEIFIADPCPSDPEELSRFKKHLWLCTEVINPYFASGTVDMPADMLDRELFNHYKAIYNSEGKDAALAAIMKEMDYPEEETENIMIRWSHNPVVFRKEWLDERVWLSFGDRKFPAGKRTIRQLFSTYGENWNLIPPKSSRVTHVGAVQIESQLVPYYTKNEEVYSILDEHDYKNVQYAYTRDSLERILTRFEMQQKIAELKRSMFQTKLDAWNKREWKYSKERQDEFSAQFREFFDRIFYFYYRKFFLQLDMSPDLLEAMTLTLIYQNKTAAAINLLNMNKVNPVYEKYMQICEDLQEMKLLRYEENIPAVTEMLDRIENEYGLKDQLETERTRIWLTSVTEKFESLDSVLEYFRTITNKEDGDIQKYVGDMVYNQGLIRDAQPFYVKSLRGNNGMLITDLRKKGYYENTSIVYPTTLNTLQLCHDFSEICRENNIPFIFGGDIIRIISSGRFRNFITAEAYIPAGDMLRFIDVMNENRYSRTRTLEYIGNNEDYSEMSVMFIDRTSTLVDRTVPYEHADNGSFIKIKPILMKHPRKSLLMYVEDKALNLSDFDKPGRKTTSKLKLKKAILKGVNWKVSRYSHERRKKQFVDYCREFSLPEFGELVWIKDTHGRYRRLPAEAITSTEDVSLLGFEVTVPKEYRSVYRTLYKQKGKVYPAHKLTSNHLYNEMVPFEEIERKLAEEEYDDRYFRNIAERKQEYRSSTHASQINKMFDKVVQLYKDTPDGKKK